MMFLVPALMLLGEPPTKELPAAEAFAKARVNGKYRLLLRHWADSAALATASAFKDVGFREAGDWVGQRNLPAGHWVYVYPHWYLWREELSTPAVARLSYSPDQACGPPNAPSGSDNGLAWTSATADGQVEWLLLEYAHPIEPTAIKIFQNCGPGAVTRVSAFKLDGSEVAVWQGTDPIPKGRPHGVSLMRVRPGFATMQIRITVNTPLVSGWNEIDAVALIDAGGATHWAVAGDASSHYGLQQRPVLPIGVVGNPSPSVAMLQRELMRLQNQVAGLQKDVAELRQEIAAMRIACRELAELMRRKQPPEQRPPVSR